LLTPLQANTNALIASHHAKGHIPVENFSALTKLDHNRGLAQLALKLGVSISDIERFCIWGNHSLTQYPDVSHAQIAGKWAKDLVDDKWLREFFYPTVQKRGAEIIAARGASSAASAASSTIDHVRDWHRGTDGKWTSMAVVSKGEYGVDEGLFYSYPVIVDAPDNWQIVRNVPIDEFSAKMMEATRKELIAERDACKEFLK
jgi:malate dehydrogenase